VTFSYELGPLMLYNDNLSLFAVALRDPREAGTELIASEQGVVSSRAISEDHSAPSSVRTVSFGSRDWSLSYYAKTNANERVQQTAVITGMIIMGLGALLFGFVVSWMR
jgi:hypothetical protein